MTFLETTISIKNHPIAQLKQSLVSQIYYVILSSRLCVHFIFHISILMSDFLKNVLYKISLSKNLQKLPICAGGQFLKIFGWNDFVKYVLKKNGLLSMISLTLLSTRSTYVYFNFISESDPLKHSERYL